MTSMLMVLAAPADHVQLGGTSTLHADISVSRDKHLTTTYQHISQLYRLINLIY